MKKQQKKKNKKKTEATQSSETPDQDTLAYVDDDESITTKPSTPELDPLEQSQQQYIRDLEAKLNSANLTISKLEQDTVSYKSQLDQPSIPNSAGQGSDDINKLNLQIESLKVENNFLNDKVYSLEARVANLVAVNKQKAIDFPRDASDFDSDIASLNSPIIESRDASRYSTGQQPRVASFAEMDLYGDINKLRDINQEMERWNGWQVDMREWRTLGVGPIFGI